MIMIMIIIKKIIFSFFREEEKILPNILHKIGNTPLVRLNRIPSENGVKCEMRKIFL